MDTSSAVLNWNYNETFNIMDNPIIVFPDQTESTHRQLVFLKCFIMAVMENKDMGRTLIQRIQTNLTGGFVALVCAMLALSSELAWKALPLILFCYSCQTLKLFAFESNLRRCISFIFNVFCCIEVAGFEFVFDVGFILSFLGMGIYSLYMTTDCNGNDRKGMHRASKMLMFFIEIGLFYYSNVIDYKFTLFVNAALTLQEAISLGWKLVHVIVMYNIMTHFLLVASILGYDVDVYFDVFIRVVLYYLIQYSGIV